ncbi:MAG TPA: peptidase domain-containing ABC transporter [Gemmatimonadales bacterium]
MFQRSRTLATPEQDPPSLREGWRLLVRFVRLIRGYWGALATGIALGLAVGLVGILVPYVSKLLIDEVYPTRNVTLMHVLVGGILAMSLASTAVGGIRTYYAQTVGGQLNTAAGLMFFNHIQHLPMRFFETHRVGEIMSRFNDLSTSLSAVSRIFETVLLRGVYLVLVPPLLFVLNWKLALLSVVTLPVTATIAAATARVLRRYWKQSAEAQAELNAYHIEVLSHVRTLKTMAAEHRTYAGARTQVREALTIRLRAAGLGVIVGSVNGAIRAGGTALFMWFGWTLILRGELTLGAYIAFVAYQGYLVGPLNQFASLFVRLQQTAVTLGRTFEYLDEPTEQDASLSFAPPTAIRHPLRGALRFEHVSFGYDPHSLVLRDLDIQIPAGSALAIVGPSGAGKSSVLRLICRLERPSAGVISADDGPLDAVPLRDLRRQIAVVWQEVALTRGTIRDNLTLGVEDVSDAEIEDAVRACLLEDVIANLPGGYDAPVAEWGASLSGGQRQRIAIARALLRQTPVLLLDEATSNLDGETEGAVIRAVFNRLPRRTLVFATHRLATAELADRIMLLDEGRMLAVGTHAELLVTCPLYGDLQGRRGAARHAEARPLRAPRAQG